MSNKLIKVEAPLPVVKTQPTPAEILQAVVEKGVTSDNVTAVKEIVGLVERMEDRKAQQAFTEAFIRLQEKIPQIRAESVVPDKHGGVRYRYASLEEIDAQARPIVLAHGFCYSFDTEIGEPGKLVAICRLRHIAGHVEPTRYGVRIGSGPYGASETQADGAALSYAKRGALCAALNIVVTHEDSDARLEGGTITKEQAEDLRRRVRETGSDEARFLKFAGAATFEEISSVKFAMLDENLRRKEKT